IDQNDRDFNYIKEVINGNLNALDSKCGVYNVGSGVARSFQDIVDILQKELHTNLTCEYIPNPYAKSYQFHTEAKLDQTWDYQPKFSLEEGIKDYLDEIKRLFEKEVNA
ncbi:ADP-glyceromanno-heptose 6-epimerase, partial [Campylobacter coli]